MFLEAHKFPTRSASDSAVDPASRSLAINYELCLKAIPGGRYGCAQFVKICGPAELMELSLGRLV